MKCPWAAIALAALFGAAAAADAVTNNTTASAVSNATANATICQQGVASGMAAPNVTTLMASPSNISEAWVFYSDCTVEIVPVTTVGEGDDANTELHCSERPIERVESLPQVQRIFLDSTRVTQADFSKYHDIIHIILASCGINRVDKFKFPDSLYELDFEDNEIRGIPAGAVPEGVSILYLGENNIESLEGFSLPSTLDSLFFRDDLFPTINFPIPNGLSELNFDENKLFTKIENLTMPRSLTTFSCTNCSIDTIRGVQFSKNLASLDLTNSTVTTFEVRASDAAILKKLRGYWGNISPTSCSEPNIQVTKLRDNLSACVISDARFEELYPVRVQPSGTDDDTSSSGDAAETPAPTTASSSSSSPSTTLIIVIAVVGGFLLIGMIVIGYRVFCSKKSRSRGDSSGEKYHDVGSTQFQGSTHSSHQPSQEYLSNDVRIDEALIRYRIDFQDLFVIHVIAKGGFGVVHLATVQNREVAVKQLLPEKAKDMSTLKSFMDEIRLCAKLEHPNVVEFVGVCWSSLMDVALVLEYMAGGDLTAALASASASQQNDSDPQDWIEASSALRAKSLLAMDIVAGLVYLHSFQSPIIHRDLKSKNVLLTADGEAKLSDFGISRRLTLDETMTGEVGTIAWTAPEVLHGERYTEKADIYSLGVMLVELDTCQHPYKNEILGNFSTPKTNARIALLVSTGKLVPQMTPSCPPAVRALAEKCTSYEPEERPAAVEIHYEIRKIQLQNLRSSMYEE